MTPSQYHVYSPGFWLPSDRAVRAGSLSAGNADIQEGAVVHRYTDTLSVEGGVRH